MLREGLADPNLPQARKVGDAQAALADREQGRRGRIPLAVPQSRDDGAADLHGVAQAGRLPGSVDVDAERGSVDGGRGRDGRPAAREGRGPQDDAGRRFRPPWRPAGLRPAGRGDRQGNARRAGEDDVVARGGHAARLLSPGEHRADEGGTRRTGQGRRHAYDDRVPVDSQGAAAPRHPPRMASTSPRCARSATCRTPSRTSR